MYLKALELQGFQSFPDKTVLNFGEDITAIVGPNGSGKSNISDAIRWVMGEQSSKALRGGKMEDVIFGGTEKRAPVGFAQVTLVLDNTGHLFPSMDESEVAVTRRYYRSGESQTVDSHILHKQRGGEARNSCYDRQKFVVLRCTVLKNIPYDYQIKHMEQNRRDII